MTNATLRTVALLLTAAACAFAGTITAGQCVGDCGGSSSGAVDMFPSLIGMYVSGGTQSISVPNAYSGILRYAVFLENNSFGDNLYAFYYQWTTTTGAVSSLAQTDFTGFMTDVAVVTTNLAAQNGVDFVSGDVTPMSIFRSDQATIGFRFAGAGITAGLSSDVLVVRTNATDWAPATSSLGGVVTYAGSTFGPSASLTTGALLLDTGVPEPGTFGLLGGAMLLLGVVGRRRLSRK